MEISDKCLLISLLRMTKEIILKLSRQAASDYWLSRSVQLSLETSTFDVTGRYNGLSNAT